MSTTEKTFKTPPEMRAYNLSRHYKLKEERTNVILEENLIPKTWTNHFNVPDDRKVSLKFKTREEFFDFLSDVRAK